MRSLLLVFFVATSAVAAENDLSVAWIARTPRIDYVWNSPNPTVDGWPSEGAEVQWVANVRWLGADALHGVAYRWSVDGEIVKSGTLDFGAESIVQTALPWKWTFTRHEIVFEVNPDGAVQETNSGNNALLVYSNALGVGIYVERTFWNGIAADLKKANFGASTFDDWMQRFVRHFNEAARYAIYPSTPNGVNDRWRIDEIHLVEDGALPLTPPYTEARNWGAPPTAGDLYPNVLDHTVDMQRGFPASTVGFWTNDTAWTLLFGNATLHELAHARTMIDTYAWNVSTAVDELHMSSPPAPVAPSNSLYGGHSQGLMHYSWGHIDPFTAAAMNQMTGRRALRGNYNEPWDLGWFLDDLPTMNRIHLIRTDGSALANRTVRIYMPRPITTAQNYGMSYGDPPDVTLTTDANGVASIPRTAFPSHISALVDRTNGTAIAKIDDGGTGRWAYIESLELNMAYWRGNHDAADLTVMADAPVCSDSVGASAVVPSPEAVVGTPDVAFQFPNTSGHHYDLHWAVDGGDPVTIAMTPVIGKNTTIKTVLTLPRGRIVWWYTDRDPPLSCPGIQSGIFGFDHTAGALLSRRRSVHH
ncbi:MAG TPA: hypothetical protein VGJ82_04035 [Thermoanaerobaculia bacterium]|jgi:hypothetical protein